jgi:uncharacterized membrane protein YhaH (DUF805 family)
MLACVTTSGLVRLCEREALPIASIAVWVVVVSAWIPSLVVPDSWMTLADGRHIVEHWLPADDSLTVWTSGRRWTDQQWAAQVTLYEVVHHGGLVAAVGLALACVALALTVCALAARRLGGSSRSTALALLAPAVASPWIGEIRAQLFAVVLFAVVYGLLALDSRRPSRRVLWVLPVLVVWANLHGSVALAAGLTAAYGLTRVRSLEGLLLVVGAPLSLLASPYGFHLASYYRVMLVDPPFAHAVVEWQPASFARPTALFFLTAFVAAVLWGSHRRLLTTFECWTLPLLLGASLIAIRNALWFELALAVSLPRLIDAAWPSAIRLTAAVRRLNMRIAVVAVSLGVVIVAAQLARTPGELRQLYPQVYADTVAMAAGPNGTVLAADEHADWLLWSEPQLAGRIAYDVRFELMDAHEIDEILRLRREAPSIWQRCAASYRVVTFADHGALDEARREHLLLPGSGTIVDTPGFIAVAQPGVESRRCDL